MRDPAVRPPSPRRPTGFHELPVFFVESDCPLLPVGSDDPLR